MQLGNWWVERCDTAQMDLGIRIFQASEHLRMAEDFRERQRVAMEKAVHGGRWIELQDNTITTDYTAVNKHIAGWKMKLN